MATENLRVAFTGASGTGKTTLTEYLAEKCNLPICPVGARSVAQEMGFATAYEVDKAGKRGEFQRKLATDKIDWESRHENFITDRTVFDNLAYTMLHDVYSVDDELLSSINRAIGRYTQIIYLPVDVFCCIDADPNRVADATYQALYDAALVGLFEKQHFDLLKLYKADLGWRKSVVLGLLPHAGAEL